MLPRRRAFTLIELLVVIAVIAVLVALLFPVFARVRAKGRQANDASNLKQIITAWQLYTDDADGMVCPSGWQGDLTSSRQRFWYAGVNYATSPMTMEYDRGLLYDYLKNTKVFDDPSVTLNGTTGWPAVVYGYNTCYLGGYGDLMVEYAHAPDPRFQVNPVSLASITAPADTVAFTDCAWYDKPVKQLDRIFTAVPPSMETAWAGPTFHVRYAPVGNVAYADGHVGSITPRYFDYRSYDGSAFSAAEARQLGLGSVDRDNNPNTDELWNGTGQP